MGFTADTGLLVSGCEGEGTGGIWVGIGAAGGGGTADTVGSAFGAAAAGAAAGLALAGAAPVFLSVKRGVPPSTFPPSGTKSFNHAICW